MMKMKISDAPGNNVTRMSPERIEELLKYVLASRFAGDIERQHIIKRGDRLSCACPYCGDSNDPRKKRGNMYISRLAYKCYNGGCEKYTDLEWFLRNHDQVHRLSDSELTSLKINIQENKAKGDHDRHIQQDANLDMMVEAQWDRLLVKREDLMKNLKLWDIHETSPQGVYLKKRMQTVDAKFAWDNFRKRLFIFNLDKTGQWVFGLQVKQMDDPSAKYKTYNIEKVHEYFMKEKSAGLLEYAAKYNSLSILFGILRVNIYQMITIFEGPMDHFLYPNSVATCGIGHEMPLDLQNRRWFQDNDTAGVKHALGNLEDGESVFLWKKMFEENPHLYGSKRKDYNDIYINGMLKNKPPGTLDMYFSNHKHDGIYL